MATNAATAASWSRVAPVSAIISASKASDSSNPWPALCATTFWLGAWLGYQYLFTIVIMSAVVGATLGIAYGIIFRTLGAFLRRIGNERLVANRDRYAVVSEAFGAAKEIKL